MKAASTIAPSRSRDEEPTTAGKTPCVWVLTNAPSPYQAELLTAIAENGLVELSVRFMRPSSAAGRAVTSAFPSRHMWSPLPAAFRDEFRLHPRALWETAFGRFDCYVLSGLYTSVSFLCCAGILTLRRKPWVLWMERPRGFRSSRFGPSLIRGILDRVRLGLLRGSTRVLCIGSAARRDYARLGVTSDKLDVLPYCCDLERYDVVAPGDISNWRQKHGLEGRTLFLYSGQLIPRKGVDTLLHAFGQLAAEDAMSTLVLLGDGPLRVELEQLVRPEHRSRVLFLGHLPQEELPIVFRSADVFVFPSRHDGWGVVINEACAARLPVIATEQTGAAHDLVEPGRSGFRHEADDTQAFLDSMRLLLLNPSLRKQMGSRSRELAEEFSPDRGAERFVSAIDRALTGT